MRAEALAQLVESHQIGVWRYLRMMGCDPTTADDLTQETFLKVFCHKEFVHHSDAAAAAYLRRTAHNLFVSMLRRAGTVQQVHAFERVDEIWNRWAGADLAGDEALDALRSCLQGLSERAQQALRMRYSDGASRMAIGVALEISEHGARNLMQRAKQQLKSCVQSKMNPKL